MEDDENGHISSTSQAAAMNPRSSSPERKRGSGELTSRSDPITDSQRSAGARTTSQNAARSLLAMFQVVAVNPDADAMQRYVPINFTEVEPGRITEYAAAILGSKICGKSLLDNKFLLELISNRLPGFYQHPVNSKEEFHHIIQRFASNAAVVETMEVQGEEGEGEAGSLEVSR
jgi:hypothetical protein